MTVPTVDAAYLRNKNLTEMVNGEFRKIKTKMGKRIVQVLKDSTRKEAFSTLISETECRQEEEEDHTFQISEKIIEFHGIVES